jgi:hypothetical protein
MEENPAARIEPDAPGESGSCLYDAHYYATSCGRPYQRDEEWLRFFGSIASRIVSDIQPASVLDAGCAWGFLVEALRQRGVEAYGLDISEYAIQHVHPDFKPYCWVGSVAEPFSQIYDLIVCIEVLEHMQPAEAEKAVENFCRFSQSVLFSSTPFDYKEATHFNVHPPEYWAELFARHGFFRDVDFDAAFVTPWAVRYVRKSEPIVRMVREYERKFFLLWKENVDLRTLTVEMRDENAGLHAELDQKNAQLIERDRVATLTTNQLNEILESQSWQLIQRAQALRLKLAPQGGKLEQAFAWLSGMLRRRQ